MFPPDPAKVDFTRPVYRYPMRAKYLDQGDPKAAASFGPEKPNMVTAVRFPKGQRIGLQISSSVFPLHERNLNTGGNNYDEAAWVEAENSVHHEPQYPSHIVLPVLSGER